jgi:hypothetical protein
MEMSLCQIYGVFTPPFLPKVKSLCAAQSTIRLSAHVLSGDARQLAAQLTGRLPGNKTPSILSCSGISTTRELNLRFSRFI